MERIAKVLKNWVQVNMSQLKTDRPLPHMSFILSKIVSHPTSYGLIRDMGPYEILKLAYTVFFMFEGDDFEVAQQKSNDLYFIEVTEIEDIKDAKWDCSDCDSDGTLECSTCYGDETLECRECDGTGEGESYGGSDEDDECGTCHGSGKVECDECYGDGEIQCYECDGDGEVSDPSVQMVDYSQSYWVTYSPDFIEDMKRKMDGDVPNDDFYDDADKDGFKGDLALLGSIRKEEDMDDLDFPQYNNGDTMVTDVEPLDKLTNIVNLFVYQGGTRNGNLKVRDFSR